MIRDVKSKLPDNAATNRTMNYILEKAVLVGGSEAKFDNTSMKEYAEFGAKKFRQINNKYQSKNGRNQEVEAVHEIISFHTDDKISPEVVRDLALSVWRDVLDLDNRKYRWAVHTDTDEIHIHLIWNKRNNKGEIYNKKDDYLLFEKLCYETEIKHGLKVVENRKFLNPLMLTNPQPSNEYRFEKKGEKSEKSKFKDEVKSAIDNAMSSSDFLEIMDARGFSIIHNGNNAYTLEKDGIGFKASDVGASYKHLKGHFGDDPGFPATLARLNRKPRESGPVGSLSGPQFQSAQDYDKKQKKMNRVLDLRFDTQDGQSYKWNGSNREAFIYENNSATFYTTSPTAIKAGFQRLAENAKNEKDKEMYLTGTNDFKRNAWLEFHKMNLDQKGFSISGYTPTNQDKLDLERIKNEVKEKYSKTKEDNAIEENQIKTDKAGKSKYSALLEKNAEMQECKDIAKREEKETEKAKHKRRMKLKPQ
ncbi:TPA: relaxase/mobilization nuclease domain-containing protein [Pseudomonas aeruginosa]|nr:relaxase/mobilization nuclease domain-containing protein [Pseudomonas aeruginosa]